jgi:hypothetical protein
MKTLLRTVSALAAIGLALILVPVSPARGGDCEDTCNSKRTTCDATCTGKQQVCIGKCGVPGVSPGYEKCFQTCNSDLSQCQLQCQGEQALCKLKCK